MHDLSHLGAKKVFIFDSGFYITETVIWALVVSVIIAAAAIWAAHRLEKIPRGKQTAAEMIVEFVYNLVSSTMGKENARRFAPYMGTILIFILISNMLGLIGLRPVTTDINCTFALAFATFFLVQYSGIKSMGLGGKLKHMAQPMAFMFPIKILEEVALPISLGFRLFGNILGGMIIMSLLYGALASVTAGLGSIPILDFIIPLPANAFFDIFEPVLQAYIFTMLSMVFIAQEIIVVGAHADAHK